MEGNIVNHETLNIHGMVRRSTFTYVSPHYSFAPLVCLFYVVDNSQFLELIFYSLQCFIYSVKMGEKIRKNKKKEGEIHKFFSLECGLIFIL